MSEFIFDLVSDDDLRANLNVDAAELEIAVKHGANKAAVVLAGSIIEAMLVDHLTATDYPKRSGKDVLKMDLANLISAGRAEGILSERTEQLSHAVRGFRNLIHPGRSLRLQEQVSGDLGQICLALVKMVCGELTDRASKSFGVTAEQLIAKLRKDPSSVRMIEHLTRKLHTGERRRYLLGKAQAAFQEATGRQAAEFRNALGSANFSLFSTAQPAVKREVMSALAELILKGDESEINTYLAHFFEGQQITYATPDDAKVIVDRILVGLAHQYDWAIRLCAGISIWLKPEQYRVLVQGIMRLIHGLPEWVGEDIGYSLKSELDIGYVDEAEEKAKKRILEDLAPDPFDVEKLVGRRWLRRVLGEGPEFQRDDDVPF
ncbi:DUF4145 domain-containing protein [Vineibacter terrae]|uniref:DUF4145 domain-containing protein n=1 Tax=Vineibacter terrae TaxID=2586908 RepID=A0A5C8PC20_9HYPH|nr:DUF4145 domain-containing protein [Vineibacter terrae]TXL71343.1 DUF4145 domain-containing protein [Vineibacter terrae]